MGRFRTLALIGLALSVAACGTAPYTVGAPSAQLEALKRKPAASATPMRALGALINNRTPRVAYDEAGGFRTQALPDRVDLRPNATPVQNQGIIGACTGFAIAGMREFLLKKETGRYTRLSPRFIYYLERQMMARSGDYPNALHEDTGAFNVDGMEVISKVGVPPEQDAPFLSLNDMMNLSRLAPQAQAQTVTGFLAAPPDNGAFGEARRYKLPNGFRHLGTLNQIKHALKTGSPVVFSMAVFESFQSEQVARTGRMPVPNPKREQMLGGHAVCIVGYDNREGHLIIRNSWGTEWGDKGYFYMPYEVIKQGMAYGALTDK